MVEIVKDKISNTFAKPGVFPQKPITGNTSVQLFVEKTKAYLRTSQVL
jgi:hypothetical protein